MTRFARAVAAAAAVVAGVLLVAAPAQAASYRKFKTSSAGYCLQPAASGRTLDVRAKSCSTSPTTRSDWETITYGTYNNHPLWTIRNRSTGGCLSRNVRSDGSGVIAVNACIDSANYVWEIFTVSSGVIALKNWGSWTQSGRHECLKYLGGTGALNTAIATCNTASTDQRWKA